MTLLIYELITIVRSVSVLMVTLVNYDVVAFKKSVFFLLITSLDAPLHCVKMVTLP